MKKSFEKLSKELQGLVYLTLAYTCFALLNVFSKQLYALEISPLVITFYRSFFCIVLVAPFAGFMLFKSHKFNFAKINIYKGVVDFLSIPAWVMAVSNMNIPEAVGLTYITPILTGVLAIIFLKDKMSADKWVVSMIGLIGAYIILKPDFDNFNYYAIYALITCLLWATGGIITKNLSGRQHPVLVVFFTNIVIVSLAFPFFLTDSHILSQREILICLCMSATAAGGYLFLTHAYRSTQISNLLPYDYLRLIMATIISYLFLGQVIDGSTILGSALIFGGSIYLARSQAKERKRTVKEV
jgi:drug/metabolite transporter (DMT)-like permease